MLPVALLELALICNFFEEAFLSSLYVLTCLLKFSLRGLRTVQIIPICKSRYDGPDMGFRNS